MKRFYDYVYQQSQDVMSHIATIESMANQLSDVGSPLSEDEVIAKIICTLQPNFDGVAAAWENLDEDKRKLPTLTTRLLKPEAERGNRPDRYHFFCQEKRTTGCSNRQDGRSWPQRTKATT